MKKRKRESKSVQNTSSNRHETDSSKENPYSFNKNHPKRMKNPKSFRRKTGNKYEEQRRNLPIFAKKKDFINTIRKHRSIIIVGETGSGKSTQITQYLLENGFARKHISQKSKAQRQSNMMIGCTQPRRVAAITVARRVSEEQGSALGTAVGYAVRFDDSTSRQTRIKYMTDGILLREAMVDPLLSAYSVIVLDEAHERSLQTDILFGLVKGIQDKRDDLKVVVMSATLEVKLFAEYFLDSASLHIPGRQYPVDVFYTVEPQKDYLDAVLISVLQIHEDQGHNAGGVLVFLPGQEEIETVGQLLRERARFSSSPLEVEVCPIYAALPQDQQLKAFQKPPPNTRKIILATNIAETSITINGIVHVIDCGFVKSRSYQAATGMEALKTVPVSKAQAHQRAGRAGREGPGMCYRLFTEASYETLQETSTPEIQRVNLAQVVLQLKVIGISSPENFDFISPPSNAALARALEILFALGALDKTGALTNYGKRMATLPLDPLYAHLLLQSIKYQCTKEILTCVAMLSAENVFYTPPHSEQKQAAWAAHKRFVSYEGDLPTLNTIYLSWLSGGRDSAWARQNYINHRSLLHARNVRKQLQKVLQDQGIDPEVSCNAEKETFLRCLVAGFFLNVAQRKAGSEGQKSKYRTINGGKEVHIHPSSALFGRNPPPKTVLFTEMLWTSRQYIRNVTAFEQSWLPEVAPQFFSKKSM